MTFSHSTARHFAESVVFRLRQAGYQAVFAGGCVRDLLLGASPKDYDVATNARPEEIRGLFGKGRTLAVGESFGVVVVIPSRGDRKRGIPPVEVATFRTEGDYRDGRHPDHVEFATAEDDAKRRDFTINGMFLDPADDRILDFVGGFDDLHNRRIRAIGDPHARMHEDKLRLLRAIRFTAALDFELDPQTSAAVRKMAPELDVVSAERIAQELRRMLVHPSRTRAIELCREHGLLAVILIELDLYLDTGGGDQVAAWMASLRRLMDPSFELAMAALLAVLPWPMNPDGTFDSPVTNIYRRLRLSNAESQRITWLLDHFGQLAGFPQMTLAQVKRLAAHPGITELLALEQAWASDDDDGVTPIDAFADFIATTPPDIIAPKPLLTGRDLIKLGLHPGPQFGTLLDAVREAQLNETIASQKEALGLVERLQP